VSVVVDPVDGVLGGRFLAHVGKKVLELHPSATDRDAASAVMKKTFIPFVVASRHHRCPCFEDRSTRATVCFAASSKRNIHLGSQTAATSDFAECQIVNAFCGRVTTNASALPVNMTADHVRALDCRESPEPLPRDILEWWHDAYSVVPVLARGYKTRAGFEDCSRMGVAA
jgi:hypothetical protein